VQDTQTWHLVLNVPGDPCETGVLLRKQISFIIATHILDGHFLSYERVFLA
jgi:hypothetical protein